MSSVDDVSAKYEPVHELVRRGLVVSVPKGPCDKATELKPMCGIGGIVGESNRDKLPSVSLDIQSRLQHRGPDDAGQFIDAEQQISLVHRRLSILDLSDAGHQPMHSADGRYTIVFNGEIYNFRSFRDSLIRDGVTFHSQSDTEVLLELFQRQGPGCVDRLEGMFAFAIWDRQERSLFLARDPLGIKPLYIWNVGNRLAFASELRALTGASLGPKKLCPDALAKYFLYGTVQEPQTLIVGIQTVPAGHWMIWRNGQIQTHCYWQLEFGAEPMEAAQAVSLTRQSLEDSIRRHFVSDVPVGIFLSGGLDSSAILALAKATGFETIQTFCISFEETEFNEGHAAAQTAAHFAADHHDWRMTSRDGQQLVEGFLHSQDLPSADGFNTYCVSKFARDNGLKVVLSGIGGDELFGGYPSFQRVPQLMRWHRTARRFGPLPNLMLHLAEKTRHASRAQRMSAFLQSDGGPQAAYWTMRSFFTPAEARALVSHFTGEEFHSTDRLLLEGSVPEQPDPSDIVGYLESTCYMRNQLLRDSDVMSMAHGLELRVPLADRRLFEQVGSIPAALRHQPGKQLLTNAVPEIPAWLLEQPKRGFRFPFERWLREHWKDTFELLDRSMPIPMGAWYRRMALLSLGNFLDRHQLR